MITFITSVFNPPSQQNLSALYSWNLVDVPSIVVSKGLQANSIPYSNVKIISEVRTEKEFGFNGDSPHLRNMLRRALKMIETSMVGLINSDILLRMDFLDQLKSIVKRRGEHAFYTSVRKDTKFPGQVSSRQQYSAVWGQPRKGHQDKSADLFISSKREFSKMVEELPDFIYARTVWDNWIHSYFKGSGIECFNTSDILEIVHLSHDYKHLGGALEDHKSVHHNLSLAKKLSPIPVGSWPQP